jgi:transposase
MQTVTTIGLDIAKSVFQVHGVDAGGQVVIDQNRTFTGLSPSKAMFWAHRNLRIWSSFF